MNTNYHKHVTVLSVFYIGLSLVGLALALFIFILLGGIGFAVDDPIATNVLATVGIVILCTLSIFAIPNLIAGIGLLTRRNWGRILTLIVSVFNLFNIPFGTAVGIYGFWVLLQDEAMVYFSSGEQSHPSSDDSDDTEGA